MPAMNSVQSALQITPSGQNFSEATPLLNQDFPLFTFSDELRMQLAEFPPLFVPNDAGKIDISKRQIPHVLIARHDHSCDPEENDIRPGHQVRGWIKFGQNERSYNDPIFFFGNKGQNIKAATQNSLHIVQILEDSSSFHGLKLIALGQVSKSLNFYSSY